MQRESFAAVPVSARVPFRRFAAAVVFFVPCRWSSVLGARAARVLLPPALPPSRGPASRIPSELRFRSAERVISVFAMRREVAHPIPSGLAAGHVADRIEHRLAEVTASFLFHLRGALLALCRGRFGFGGSLLCWRGAFLRGRRRFRRRLCSFRDRPLCFWPQASCSRQPLSWFWARTWPRARPTSFSFSLSWGNLALLTPRR